MQRDSIHKNVYTENISNRVSSSKGQITKGSSNPTYGKESNKQKTAKMFWLTESISLIFYEHQALEKSILGRVYKMHNIERDLRYKNPLKQKSYCAF